MNLKTSVRSPGAEDKFKEISEAYACLSDDKKRKESVEFRRIVRMTLSQKFNSRDSEEGDAESAIFQ